jgi:hypothetical protein
MPQKVVSQPEAGAAAPEQKDRTSEQAAANAAAIAKRVGTGVVEKAYWTSLTPKERAINDRRMGYADELRQAVLTSPATQEAKADAYGKIRIYETPLTDSKFNPRHNDDKWIVGELMSIHGIGDDLPTVKKIVAPTFNLETDLAVINGTLTPERAEQLKQQNTQALEQVHTWDNYLHYRQAADTMLSQQVHSDFSFRAASSFPTGFSASASSMSKAVGISLNVSSQLASAALGGQIANASRNVIDSATESPKPEHADEGGFLIASGESKKAPTTREDAGSLIPELAHAAAEIMNEKPLAENEAARDNLVASNLVSDVIARRKGKGNWEA